MKLTNRAILYLRSVLEAVGWAKTHSDIFRAGEVLCNVLPDGSDAPETVLQRTELGVMSVPVDKKAYEAWCAQEVEITFNAKQIAVCKTALTNLADKLNPGKATFELLQKFELGE